MLAESWSYYMIVCHMLDDCVLVLSKWVYMSGDVVDHCMYYVSLLLFHVLATSKVISRWVSTCDSAYR